MIKNKLINLNCPPSQITIQIYLTGAIDKLKIIIIKNNKAKVRKKEKKPQITLRIK